MTDQPIIIKKPTPEEYALFFELARHVFAHNPRVLAVVERADLWERYLEQARAQAAARHRADAEVSASIVDTSGAESAETEEQSVRRRVMAALEKAESSFPDDLGAKVDGVSGEATASRVNGSAPEAV